MSDHTGTGEREALDGVAEPVAVGRGPADPGPTGRHERPPVVPPPPPSEMAGAVGPRAAEPVRDPVTVDGIDSGVEGEQDDTARLDDPFGPAPHEAPVPAVRPVPTAPTRRAGPPPAEPPSATRVSRVPASTRRDEPATVELSPDEAPAEKPAEKPAGAPVGEAPSTPPPPGETGSSGSSALDKGELTARWQRVQSAFVDEPRRAVEEADALVEETMRQLTEALAAERRNLAAHWREGGDGSASATEELRLALRRYRDLFHRMLAA